MREYHVRFCERPRVKFPRPTRQYFCGFEFFQTEYPIDPSTMTRWRKRIGPDGLSKMLKASVDAALDTGTVKPVITGAILPNSAV